ACVLIPLGSPARQASPAALPLSSTASTAREHARALDPDPEPASASASCSSSWALRAAATAHASSSARLAAITARRSTAPPGCGHRDANQPVHLITGELMVIIRAQGRQGCFQAV